MNYSFSRFIEITLAIAIGLAGLASWNYFRAKPLEAYQFDKAILETARPEVVADILRLADISCDDFQFVSPNEQVQEEAVCGSRSAPLRFFYFENPTKLMDALSIRSVAPSCNKYRRQFAVVNGLSIVRSPSQTLIEAVSKAYGGVRLTIECTNRQQ